LEAAVICLHLLADPGAREVVLVEYNGDSDLFFRGRYEPLEHGGVIRTYDASFPDGTIRRFRETWRWNGQERTSFDWITEEWSDGRFVRRDIVVKMNRVRPRD
jgi:hypothetical protein